jgi:lipopolysaccharide transport system ATP-binding protein
MTTPDFAMPMRQGVYLARCIIAPFTLNSGRFSAGLALSTYTPVTIVHFDAQFALRFEVVENGNTDPRRHGWEGVYPGLTRPRLDWNVDSLAE